MRIRNTVSVSHPSYSPDLASGNFCLSPTVKEAVERAGITDEHQLFEELHIILRSVPEEELERVFEAWRERVQDGNQGDASRTHQ
jgi:hypothetical protein